MTYTIPDELAPYLEYIPDDMLTSIITDALRAAVFKPIEAPVIESNQHFDVSQLLEQIRGMVDNQAVQQVKSALSAPTTPKSETVVAVTTNAAADVDEDMRDIVASFAASVIK